MIMRIFIQLTLLEIDNFFNRLVSLFKSWIEVLNCVSTAIFGELAMNPLMHNDPKWSDTL